MNPIWLVIFFITNVMPAPRTIPVQFVKSAIGLNVTVAIDGKVEQTFAGKLSFKDEQHAWTSVCADVRSPIQSGQIFPMRILTSRNGSGNISLAGNIVAKYFNAAQSPDQCAALQLAVWKAIEDGESEADFTTGHFQAEASPAVMALAAFYYQGINNPGNSIFLQAGAGGQGSGQSQLSTG